MSPAALVLESQVGLDRAQIRVAGPDEGILDSPGVGLRCEMTRQSCHVLAIAAADFIGLDVHHFAAFHVDEAREVHAGQVQLVGIEDLQQEHLVFAMEELRERVEEFLVVAQEIG